MCNAAPVGVPDSVRHGDSRPELLLEAHLSSMLAEVTCVHVLHGNPRYRRRVVIDYRDDVVVVVELLPRFGFLHHALDDTDIEGPAHARLFDREVDRLSVGSADPSTEHVGVATLADGLTTLDIVVGRRVPRCRRNRCRDTPASIGDSFPEAVVSTRQRVDAVDRGRGRAPQLSPVSSNGGYRRGGQRPSRGRPAWWSPPNRATFCTVEVLITLSTTPRLSLLGSCRAVEVVAQPLWVSDHGTGGPLIATAVGCRVCPPQRSGLPLLLVSSVHTTVV